MQRIKTQRERKRRKTQSNYTGSFHKPEVVLSPLHFQGEFTKKCNIWLQLLTATTCKRLQITQAQLQEISYAPELNQETSYAQAHKQETSIQIELQRNLFDVEHLIYNQWCSQCKSDTDSQDSKISKIWTLIRNSKWTFDVEQLQQSFGACKLLLLLLLILLSVLFSKFSLLYVGTRVFQVTYWVLTITRY